MMWTYHMNMLMYVAFTSQFTQRSMAWTVSHRNCRTPTRLFYSRLAGKNLASVHECMDAVNDVVFVDGSWYHKGSRAGRDDFEAGPRLPGARYIDMDDLSCRKDLFPDLNPKGLGHMLPPRELFALAMDEFGITNDDHVVVYGREGSVFTPRTWFLFRTMGHKNVSLMQGSLEDWKAQGGPVEEGRTSISTAAGIIAKGGSPSYQAKKPTNVVTMDEMLQSLDEDVTIVDPRGSSFSSMGHIPGAIHVPYSSLVEKDNYLKLKPRKELREIFVKAGVDIHTEKKIIATCGSGVSVCHILLALEECGRDVTKPSFMYDGSWAEWGTDPNTPKNLPES